MSTRGVVGVVAGDPVENASDGFKLRIERLSFPPEQVASNERDWSSFKGVLLKLLFGDAKCSRVMGSGVMVAPGVALAARHVIEPELDAIMDERAGFLAMAITPGGLEIWRVRQVVMQEKKDVALLSLRRASVLNDDASIAQAILTTRLPAVGEVVSICGFVADRLEHVDGIIQGRVHISQGLVTEHFLDGRDLCMLPGPCFAVGVGTPGGLSGGPAFDGTGRLVGLLSTSLGPEVDDTSFVSLIHPILVEKFTPCWPTHLFKSPTLLLEYDPRLCEIQGADRIRPDGDAYAYEVWS